jgi:hypothetical protein
MVNYNDTEIKQNVLADLKRGEKEIDTNTETNIKTESH